jgi:ribose transport system ATP-binding protein
MATHITSEDTQITDEPTMVLSGISKSYAGVAALTDVSLEILPGEIHALLGENGAGKSTLMGIASGEIAADAGTITFAGSQQPLLNPKLANSLGIAIVHQHPALLPDMTVAENIRLAVPAQHLAFAGDEEASLRAVLDEVGMNVHLNDRASSLSIANQHLLEVAKALAVSPKVLILDEPTAPLGKDSVDLLFEHVRAAAAEGTAVVYITHRLAEVRLLADRVTVLRDGKVSGTAEVDDVSDDQLLAWIVGRRLIGSTFPEKASAEEAAEYVKVTDLSGPGFSHISVTANRGEIIGVAGVVGNGQSQLLAALAGLAPFKGSVDVNGQPYSSSALRTHAAYMPADRHREGLMMSLSVRENAAVSALQRFRQAVFVRRDLETTGVQAELDALNVRTPSMEANVASLSGGNQQKVVMSRALLRKPAMLIADEPTQGVDVGARAEIYRIIREVAAGGIPVIVASSDAHELEGLCDRVIVMSRGQSVVELTGDAVTEERIVRAAVSATTQQDYQEGPVAKAGSSSWGRFLQGDYAPVLILALVIVALGAYIYSTNDRYINAFNITSVLMLVAALGLIAIGQTVALMVAGIDLSVGPLAGLLVVVASFFLVDERSFAVMAFGFLLMLVIAVIIGSVNGVLIRYGRFTPVAATLAMYIALGGLSFVLRDRPGGFMSSTITGPIMARLGPVPWAFMVLVVIAILMELALRKTEWGRRLRAIGSHEDSARRLGINVNRTAVAAYVTTSLFVFLGAIILLAQLGVGDPAQGVGYTLSSVTAVVLGGTSLLGGRGTFIGTLFGAFLIVQVQNATVFLGLNQTWQYFFQGALIMAAAIIYSQVRGLRRAL